MPPFSRRFRAWSVDGIAIGGLLIIVGGIASAFIGGTEQQETERMDAVAMISLVLVPVAYMASFEARSGQTPGKRVAGIKVVALDGRNPLGARRALARAFYRLISALPVGLGYAWAATKERRTWHDLATNTVVLDADALVIVPPRSAETGDSKPPAPVDGAPPPLRQALEEPQERGDDVVPDDHAAMRAPAPPIRLRWLATALRARHHWEEAASLSALALRHENRAAPDEWCDVALGFVDGGRPADALAIVNRVLLDDANDSRAAAVKALALLQLGVDGYAEALELAQRARLHDARSPLAAIASAFALNAHDRPDEASATLDGIAEIGSEHVRACLCRAAIARTRGDADAVRQWTATAAVDADFDAGLRFRLARSADRRSYGSPGSRAVLGDAVHLFIGLFRPTRDLGEQAEQLVAAVDAEPQHVGAREALRKLETYGEKRPWSYAGTVLGSATGALVLAWMGANGLSGGDLSNGEWALPSWVVIVVAVGVVGAVLTIPRQLIERGQLDERSRAWIAYVRRIQQAQDTQARKRRWRWSSAAEQPPLLPQPPAGTVMATPASCHCDSLNFLHGDLAVSYARMHLASTLDHGNQLFEMTCPATLTRWLVFEAGTIGVGEHRPVRLCRLGDVEQLAVEPESLPGQYL